MVIMLINLIIIGKSTKIFNICVNIFFIKGSNVYNKIYFKIKLKFKVKVYFSFKLIIYKRFYNL